jgi:hypothetical protein
LMASTMSARRPSSSSLVIPTSVCSSELIPKKPHYAAFLLRFYNKIGARRIILLLA